MPHLISYGVTRLSGQIQSLQSQQYLKKVVAAQLQGLLITFQDDGQALHHASKSLPGCARLSQEKDCRICVLGGCRLGTRLTKSTHCEE